MQDNWKTVVDFYLLHTNLFYKPLSKMLTREICAHPVKFGPHQHLLFCFMNNTKLRRTHKKYRYVDYKAANIYFDVALLAEQLDLDESVWQTDILYCKMFQEKITRVLIRANKDGSYTTFVSYNIIYRILQKEVPLLVDEIDKEVKEYFGDVYSII